MKGEFMSFSISGFPTPQDNNTTRRQSRQQKLQGFFTGGKPIKTPEIRSIHDNNNGLTRVAGGVTKHNNEFGIFRDAQGNSIARIDYQNNDAPNIFDEEEVRSKDGKLKSRTSRSYIDDGTSYYKKYEYDENENLKNVTETTCDASGNVIKTTNKPVKDVPELEGHVSIGVGGETGDKELQAKMAEHGFTSVGQN